MSDTDKFEWQETVDPAVAPLEKRRGVSTELIKGTASTRPFVPAPPCTDVKLASYSLASLVCMAVD
jgi:hypothetical protein